MSRRIDFLWVICVFLVGINLYAQNDLIISYELDEAQIDDEIHRYIQREFEKAGIQEGEERYSDVKDVLDKIELKLNKIKDEQAAVFDHYGNQSDSEVMKALKLLRNLYYAERSVSALLLDGYYRNTSEYNSELIDNMGLIEEEVVNLKEYQKEIRANIQSAHDAVDQSYTSMKNLADIIAGYKNIIAEQQRIIREEIAGKDGKAYQGFGDISFSLLGGTGWYEDAALTAPDVQVGFEVEFALNSWFGVGIGAITSLPVRGNQVFLEACFRPGEE